MYRCCVIHIGFAIFDGRRKDIAVRKVIDRGHLLGTRVIGVDLVIVIHYTADIHTQREHEGAAEVKQ